MRLTRTTRTLAVAATAGATVLATAVAAHAGQDIDLRATDASAGSIGQAFFDADAGSGNELFRVCDQREDGVFVKGQIRWPGQTIIGLGDPNGGQAGCGSVEVRIPEGTRVEVRIASRRGANPQAGDYGSWASGVA